MYIIIQNGRLFKRGKSIWQKYNDDENIFLNYLKNSSLSEYAAKSVGYFNKSILLNLEFNF